MDAMQGGFSKMNGRDIGTKIFDMIDINYFCCLKVDQSRLEKHLLV